MSGFIKASNQQENMMNKFENNEIHTLVYLVIKSTEVLVACKSLLSDTEKFDLQKAALQLESLFS